MVFKVVIVQRMAIVAKAATYAMFLEKDDEQTCLVLEMIED